MLHAHKANLQTNLRQRLLAIRERELDYYTDINRNIGNQAALIAGFAYSGIRYHYLVDGSTVAALGRRPLEEAFTSLLTMAMGCGLQAMLIAMLVAMLESLALRGGDGALHDAVKGCRRGRPPSSSSSSSRSSCCRREPALFSPCARARNPRRSRHTSPACCALSALSFAFGHRRWAPSRAARSPPPSASRSSRRSGRPSSRSQFRLPKEARRRAVRRNSAQFCAARRVRRAHVLEASPRARVAGGDHGRVPLH